MKRVGIFVDVSDLYHRLCRRYRGRKLDYQKFYNFVSDFGQIVQAQAYGSQTKSGASRFISAIKSVGFYPKYKEEANYNWNVGIAIDILTMADRLDMVVIASSSGELEPVVKWCRDHGIDVVVFGCGVAQSVSDVANESIEIPESLLENHRKYEAPKAAKSQLPPLLDGDAP